jgi:multidrug efflux system membrane fusion protein
MTANSRSPQVRALQICAVLATMLVAGCSKEPERQEDVRPVTVVKVAPWEGSVQTSYTGDVRPRYETALGFRVAGKIVARKVEVGSRVQRGQELARLDPSDYRLNIEAAKSQLAAAQSDYLQAKDDLQRYRELFDKKFISAAEFDRRQNAYTVAQAKLEQAQAELGVTQNQSAYTSLRADRDGIITSISAEVGQVVSAGQEVMRLAQLGEKEVVVSVPEGRLDELRAVDQVAITLWAAPDARFAGHIREISPSADPVTRTYSVKVTILKPTAQVQLGMTANVLLGEERTGAVVHLPLSALYQNGKEPAVWVVDPKTSQVKLTPVTVVRYTQEAVEIGAGLHPGDVVVRAGVHKLTAGQRVRIIAPSA